jgi:hypothetical protein
MKKNPKVKSEFFTLSKIFISKIFKNKKGGLCPQIKRLRKLL